jgi:hypothetical protein
MSEAIETYPPHSGSVESCLFCDKPRKLKIGCQKQRWLVCDEHMTTKCPECGGMAMFMEGMKRGNYYLCFDSLKCWWRSSEPNGANLPRSEAE